MPYELNGRKYQRESWDHSKACAYCTNRGAGMTCKHVRGGKTARKRAARRPVE